MALIAAQSIVLGHDLAGDSHAPDSVCEYCIAGASLAGTSVDAVKAVAPLMVSIRVPDSGIDRARSDAFRGSRFARAPPSVS